MYIFENHYLSFNGSNECKFVFHIIEWKWSKVENLKKEAMPDLKLSQSFWEKNWIDNLEVYRCIHILSSLNALVQKLIHQIF